MEISNNLEEKESTSDLGGGNNANNQAISSSSNFNKYKIPFKFQVTNHKDKRDKFKLTGNPESASQPSADLSTSHNTAVLYSQPQAH